MAVNMRDYTGQTPLHGAAERGNVAIVRFLLENGAEINAADKDNRIPLHLAAQNGHIEIVKLLIETEAKVEVVDKDNSTPLHLAADKRNWKIVVALLKAGANINDLSNEQCNLLKDHVVNNLDNNDENKQHILRLIERHPSTLSIENLDALNQHSTDVGIPSGIDPCGSQLKY
jgi:ankyrin repeat protein